MKRYSWLFLMVAATAICFAGDKKTNNSTETVYVRLAKVTHGSYEFATLIATFEPIRLNSGFGGGGRGGGGFGGAPREAETVIGKPFTVEMLHPSPLRTVEVRAHLSSLINVIQSCADVHKPDTTPLKLHLVLSIPVDQAKEIFDERDFSEWVIQSVDTVH